MESQTGKECAQSEEANDSMRIDRWGVGLGAVYCSI